MYGFIIILRFLLRSHGRVRFWKPGRMTESFCLIHCTWSTSSDGGVCWWRPTRISLPDSYSSDVRAMRSTSASTPNLSPLRLVLIRAAIKINFLLTAKLGLLIPPSSATKRITRFNAKTRLKNYRCTPHTNDSDSSNDCWRKMALTT